MSTLCLIVACAGILPGLVSDAEADLRDAIYEEVALGKTEEALAAYRRILADGEAPAEIRARALQRLAVCLAKAGRPEEAAEAIRSLGEKFPDRADLHRRAQDEVGRYIEKPASRFGRPRMEDLILTLGTGDKEGAQEAGRMLKLLAPESVPILKKTLDHPDLTLRLRAAEVLWSMGDPAGFETFWSDLGSRQSHYGLLWWGSSIHILGSIVERDPKIREEVLGRLDKAGEEERWSIFEVLRSGGVRTSAVFHAAHEMLESESHRRSALQFLTSEAPPETALKAALAAVDKDAGAQVAWVVDTFMDRLRKDPECRPQGWEKLLLEAISHPAPEARRQVAGRLHRWIQGRGREGREGGMSAEMTFEIVDGLLASDDEDVRGYAANVLDRLVGLSTEQGWLDEVRGGCAERYERMLDADRSSLPEGGLRGLYQIASEDREVRDRVLPHALRRLNDPAGQRWLKKITDEDPQLTIDEVERLIETEEAPGQLLRVIEWFPAEQRLALLEKCLKKWPERGSFVAGALSRVKDARAVPALREIVRGEDRHARLIALKALGSYGAIDAVPDIIPMLTDLDENLREAAREALKEIRRLDEEKDEWSEWYRTRKKE